MDGFARIPLTRFQHYRAWSVDDSLVVFNRQAETVRVLDPLTAWLLLSMDAGLTQDEIASELAGQGHAEGLLDAAYASMDQPSQNPASLSESQSGFVQEYARVIASSPGQTNASDGIRFSLLGRLFQLQTGLSGLLSEIQRLCLHDAACANRAVDYQLVIRQQDPGYRLECNGIALIHLHDYAHILPVLMDHIQIIAYQSFDYLLAVHSAVVSVHDKGVLLPGRSGAGKSTLTVSLMRRGHICYSDEIAVISSHSHRAMPLPLPAALKSGSWHLTGGMDDVSIWSRPDGRTCKYIRLPHATRGLAELPVSCIIFPRYAATQRKAKMAPLSPLAALQGLIEAGYQIRNTLTESKVERILAWVNATPAYQLDYACLEQAHQLIEQQIA